MSQKQNIFTLKVLKAFVISPKKSQTFTRKKSKTKTFCQTEARRVSSFSGAYATITLDQLSEHFFGSWKSRQARDAIRDRRGPGEADCCESTAKYRSCVGIRTTCFRHFIFPLRESAAFWRIFFSTTPNFHCNSLEIFFCEQFFFNYNSAVSCTADLLNKSHKE